MYRKCLLLKLLFISSVHFSSGQLYAQEEEGEIITISERVGKEIDQEERDKYELFQGIEGFQSAVFLKLPDNSYVLKITHQNEITGELKTERIQQSEQSMKGHRNYIDHYEEIPAREQSIINITDVYRKPGTSFYLELGGKLMVSYNVDFRIKKSTSICFSLHSPWGWVPNLSEGITPSFMYYHLRGENYNFEVGGGFTYVPVKYKDFKGSPVLFHGVVGYRYQKKNGLLFRIGITAIIHKYFGFGITPSPGISIGYSL